MGPWGMLDMLFLGHLVLLSPLIPVSNYIQYKVWDEITYPFPYFNYATIEFCEMDK